MPSGFFLRAGFVELECDQPFFFSPR
jgi:hypothetical protein